MKTWIIFFLLLAGSVGAYAQKKGTLPEDKTIRKGILKNGMTYYIVKNDKPAKHASFYLVTRIGALMEDDDQNGLAHFLEHMAFNGSKLFPGNSLISTMERQGIVYGKNLNAYTSYGETVYNITDAPVTNSNVIDTCLMVISEWSDGLLLRDEDIEAERGVIVEEWRTGRTSDARIGEQVMDVMFNGAKYARHNVIGDVDVIKGFAPQRLRDFYERWHRPDLQAIIVAGDIDVKDMEHRIIKRFENLPVLEDAPRPVYDTIPDQVTPRYVAAMDPEQENIVISIAFRHKNVTGKDVDYEWYKNDFMTRLYNNLISERIKQLKNERDALLHVQIAYGEFIPGYSTYSLIIVPRPGKELEAVQQAYLIHENVRVNGFTQDEFARVKAELMLSMSMAYGQGSKSSNEGYVRQCKENFLYGMPMVSRDTYYKFFSRAIKEIKLQDINLLVTKWVNSPNLGIAVGGPTRMKENFPTERQICDILGKTVLGQDNLTRQQETPKTIFTRKVIPGKIVKEERIEELKAEKWMLSNGATVVYKYCDKSKTLVNVKASSDGGLSLYSPKELPSAALIPLYARHGLGDYDFEAISRYMMGRNAALSLSVEELSEDLDGGADVKDIETLFQLMHLVFVKPRFDQNVFNMMVSNTMVQVRQQQANVNKQLQDTITAILNGHSPRVRPMNESYVEDMDFEVFKRIIKERFGDAGDFVFYFVGNIQKKELEKLVEKYIASIPSSGKKEKFVIHESTRPKGKFSYRLQAPMTQARGTVILSYNKEMAFEHKSAFCSLIYCEILKMRLFEVIREKMGGTYDVSVQNHVSRVPREEVNVNVQFQCDPTRLDILHDLTLKEIQNLLENGVRKSDFVKVVSALQKQMNISVKDNDYWMNCLEQYIQFGDNLDTPGMTTKLVASLTMEDINAWMKAYFSDINIVDIRVCPCD